MPRSLRQSKILELISTREIEKQEELVSLLKDANFDITQATISRDIKELGLIKILSDNKKYKYAYVETSDQNVSNKYIVIFKEAVLSFRQLDNLVIIKTIKGLAGAINSFVERLSIGNIIGSVFGEDTVTIYFENNNSANIATITPNKIIYS
ncbi:MAG: arginine repressor [Clostridia bacterium]|nr:arginine repressor [Clostridia bacterium]